MSETDELLARIQTALGTAVTPSLTASSDGSDLFEAFVFFTVVEAAKAEGATVAFETVDGRPATSTFYFRTSPGHIYSTAHDYTHAVIQFPGKPTLELHAGIFVLGSSLVLHECDVALVYRRHAIDCRADREDPRAAKVPLAAEAKYYSISLHLSLGREFIGFSSEIRGQGAVCFVSNSDSASVSRLLASKGGAWYHNVLVAQSSVEPLTHYLRTTFRNFKARA